MDQSDPVVGQIDGIAAGVEGAFTLGEWACNLDLPWSISVYPNVNGPAGQRYIDRTICRQRF